MTLADWVQQLINQSLGPLGLREDFMEQVEVLRREGADERYIEWNIERVIHGAEGYSRRYGKPKEYYLRRAVENEYLLHW